MLHRPQSVFFSCLWVSLYSRKRQNSPFVRFNLLQIATEVMFVESLQDYENRCITRISTVTNSVLKSQVDTLSYNLRVIIFWLHRVVNQNCTLKHISPSSYAFKHLIYIFVEAKQHIVFFHSCQIIFCSINISSSK